MKRKIIIITIISSAFILGGCLNMFRAEEEHNGNSINLESVKATTSKIELFADKSEIKVTSGTAVFSMTIYNNYNVKMVGTEADVYVNGERRATVSNNRYEFTGASEGEYTIYAQKGMTKSNEIKVKVVN